MTEVRISSRPIQSCFQCRKRKIKCSKSYPCTPCILRGEGDACREVDRNLLQSTERIEELVDRVQKLENTISVLSRRGSPSDDESPRSIRRRELSSSPYSKCPSLSPNRSRSKGSYPQPPSLLRVGTSAEEGALILEDFALGHKVNSTRATNDFCASPFSTPPTSNDNLPLTNFPVSHPWSFFINSPQDIIRRILCILPTQAQIQLLLRFYVQQVDWYAKVIHVPTFMAETNHLLSQIHNHQYHLVNIDFLGVLLGVLCLSFHFSDARLCEQLFLDYSACSDYAQHLYGGAQACLQYANFIGCHTLEHLQTIVLMGAYQQNHAESDSHWALIGTAIKIAQNIGMSRLGNETGSRQYPPEWRSSIRREVARRVWWNLVLEDWSHAMAHHGTYSVHPSQNHTSFPANIDDADLIEADVVQSRPLNIHTETSSILCRLRLIELHRQVIDEINCGGYELEFAREMDSKITNAIGEIKDYFQVSTCDPQKFNRPNHITSLERTLCHMMAQMRLLQLHRPFLFKGGLDNIHVDSRNQCIKSAQLILQHLGTNRQGEKLLRLSTAVSYGFAAVVVLLVDLCHLRYNGTESEIERRRKDIQDALQLFRSVGDNAPPVTGNAIRLIENLLVEESILSKGVKHTLSSEENTSTFEQVVKRLIITASGGTRSMSNTANLIASFGVGTPSNLTGGMTTSEQLWDPRSFDINKLPSSPLSVQGLQLHSFDVGGGGQFDQGTVSYLSTTLLPS